MHGRVGSGTIGVGEGAGEGVHQEGSLLVCKADAVAEWVARNVAEGVADGASKSRGGCGRHDGEGRETHVDGL